MVVGVGVGLRGAVFTVFTHTVEECVTESGVHR